MILVTYFLRSFLDDNEKYVVHQENQRQVCQENRRRRCVIILFVLHSLHIVLIYFYYNYQIIGFISTRFLHKYSVLY